MAHSFSAPPVRDSGLSRWDPRWKLAGVTLAGIALLILQSPWTASLGLIGVITLLLWSGLPVRWWLRRLAGIALFVGFFVIWFPLLDSRDPAWRMGPVRLSLPGLEQAILILAKSLAISGLLLMLWVTTPLDATLKAAHSLGMPGLLIHLVWLTYRYLFLLADEFARIRLAVRMRGFQGSMNRHTYRTIGHVTGTLLVRSQERAERVSQAMRCRGFDGTFRTLTQFHTQPGDVVGFLLLTVLLAFLVMGDRFLLP